jgi:hypothetical protein
MNRNLVGSIYGRTKQLQRRRFFRNQPIRNKNCLWQPCLLTDRYEMSNLYRGHSKDASYQVSIHLAMRLQRISFFYLYKDCSFRPDLITNMAAIGNSHFCLVNL